MSDQLVGILLGVFSALAAAVIYWGGFREQRRANEEYAARRGLREAQSS